MSSLRTPPRPARKPTRLLLVCTSTMNVSIMDGRKVLGVATLSPENFTDRKHMLNDLEFYRRKGDFNPPNDW